MEEFLADEGWEMFDSILRRARQVDAQRAFRVSLASLSLALAIALSTVLPGAPFLPDWTVFPLMLGVILVHFRTVGLSLARPRGRRKVKEVLKLLSRRAQWAYTAAAVVTWILILVLLFGATGQPTQSNGHFYLNNHGSLMPVSHADYVSEQLRLQRIFSLGAAWFFGAAVIFNWVALRTPEAFRLSSTSPDGDS
jgi:hypothetical protein